MINITATATHEIGPNAPDRYIEDVVRHIKRAWNPPKGRESEEIIVSFKIHKEKKVDSQLRVIKSSDKECKDVALKAVENASRRFRPLPERFGACIEVTLTFDGNLYRTSGTESNVTWKRLQDSD